VALSLGLAAAAFGQNPTPLEINSTYGLDRSELVNVDLDGTIGQSIAVTVAIEGNKHRLLLSPKSVRADNFQLLEQLEDGSYVSVDPGPVSTYRGVIAAQPDVQIAGGMQASGLFAKLTYPDGRVMWLQPIAREFPGADLGAYVLFDDVSIIEDSSARCGTDSLPSQPGLVVSGGGSTHQAGTLQVAEIGCDADFQYYEDYNSSTTDTSNRIQNVLGTMNTQYETQTNLTHMITTIIVRTTNNDPYSSTDAVTLLNQFRNHWNSQQGGIQRDVAQLFTGKNVDGGTIGIAWLNAVCTSFGYGVVESDFNNNFGCATDLSAHELGHNWGGNHCSCTSFTMNPFITCANSFNNFSIGEITNYAASVNCLDNGGGGCTDDSFENNDSCNQAVLIGSGITGNLVSSDADADYFSVSVPAFGTVTVDVVFLHSDGDVDVELTNSNCSTTYDSGASASNNETVTYTNPGNSTELVKLEIFLFTGNGCVGYSLDVDIQAGDPCQGPDDQFEPNDDCGSAAQIGNFAFDSLYVEKTDPDFYEMCVDAGDTLNIELFFAHADGDIDAYLYDSASCGGSALVSSLSTSNNEQILWTNNTGSNQSVFLEVQVWQNSSSDCNTYVITSLGGGGDCSGSQPGPIGTNYCAANVNSTSFPALISGFGTNVVADDDVQLTTILLPSNQSGYYLASPNQTFVANPGGSQGNLCIGSPSARLVGQVASSGPGGSITIQVDTTDMPTSPSQPILAGQTWNFQLWYRDFNPGPTSNFSGGLSILFQ
jgi:hypothetical protein